MAAYLAQDILQVESSHRRVPPGRKDIPPYEIRLNEDEMAKPALRGWVISKLCYI